MIEGLLKQRTAPGELHTCPECAGKLHLRFEVYSRGVKRLLGINAWCENCSLAVATDYTEKRIPTWLQVDAENNPPHVKGYGSQENRAQVMVGATVACRPASPPLRAVRARSVPLTRLFRTGHTCAVTDPASLSAKSAIVRFASPNASAIDLSCRACAFRTLSSAGVLSALRAGPRVPNRLVAACAGLRCRRAPSGGRSTGLTRRSGRGTVQSLYENLFQYGNR